MAGPYTVDNVTDIPLSDSASLLVGERGRTLAEPSRVVIYANRETNAVTFDITLGPDQLMSQGIAAIAAAAGSAPSTRDDKIVDSFGNAGDEIIIRASNSDAAAAREARVIVFVTPVRDDMLMKVMDNL